MNQINITEAIAEITSASHDNAEHGERGIRILRDFQHLEYGTKLYAHPAQCLHQIQEPSPVQETHAAAPIPDERAAFEAWTLESAIRSDLGAWEAWQARAALSATPAAPELHREWRSAFQEAIDTMEAEIDSRSDAENVRRMKRATSVLRSMLAATPAADGYTEMLEESFGITEPAAAEQVVLPEPEHWLINSRGEKTYMSVSRFTASSFDTGHYTKLYTEQQVRALLAGVSAPAAPLLARATDLHEKGFMPWAEAEELALSEAGIDDAAIDELVGNCGSSGLSSVICTPDELRTFTRAVLVHQPATTAPAAPQGKEGARDAESDYQRGYRHGYNRRDAEVQGALL